MRAVPLGKKEGDCIEANAENAYSGKYPLARFLYIYLNKNPNEPLDPLRGEFIKYVLSKQGQQAVIKDGYYPITAAVVDRDAKTLGFDELTQ